MFPNHPKLQWDNRKIVPNRKTRRKQAALIRKKPNLMKLHPELFRFI